jgi:hypothetical protein
VLQLHRDLYQFTVGEGGRWKSVDNVISETYPDGRKVVRFQPVPAYATPDAMQRLQSTNKPAKCSKLNKDMLTFFIFR